MSLINEALKKAAAEKTKETKQANRKRKIKQPEPIEPIEPMLTIDDAVELGKEEKIAQTIQIGGGKRFMWRDMMKFAGVFLGGCVFLAALYLIYTGITSLNKGEAPVKASVQMQPVQMQSVQVQPTQRQAVQMQAPVMPESTSLPQSTVIEKRVVIETILPSTESPNTGQVFTAINAKTPLLQSTGYVLTGIVPDDTLPMAIINGKSVILGDSIDGARVAAIERNRVVLLQGNKEIVVELQ